MLKQKTFKFRNTCVKIGICLLLAACTSSGNDNGPRPCANFDCKGMLANLGNNIMFPAIQKFNTDAVAMSTAVDDYVLALATDPNETTRRDEARVAWKMAMTSFQVLEMMKVGPLTDEGGALRDTIYSWPTTNSCQVDQQVLFAETEKLIDGVTAYDLTQQDVQQRGMDALGYVLFSKNPDGSENLNHSCVGTTVPVNPVNSSTWNIRPDAERRSARAKYAKLAAADVANQAQILLNKWNGTDGNFLIELTQPGSNGSQFTSVEKAVNVVSDALFYYEDETKDRKLAEPLGVQNTKVDNACNTRDTGCADAVESPFSLTSKENIQTNLLTLQELFLGNKPGETARLGFDDFLEKMGGTNASAPLRDGIEKALPTLAAITGDLKSAVGTDYDTVKLAWDAARVITDQLKLNFVAILGLNIPTSSANDGD